MPKTLLAVVLAASAAALLSGTGLDGPRTREIVSYIGTPIEKDIRPDDEVVVVRPMEEGPAAVGRPSVQQVVDGIRHEADMVLVAEIVGASAHLTPARDWIVTDLSLYAHEVVFRGRHSTYSQGQRKQQFSVTGGELFVGNALVRTERMFSLKIGGTYLLCVAKGKGGGSVSIWVYPPLLVGEDGRLIGKRSDFIPQYHDPLGGQALSKVVALLKRP